MTITIAAGPTGDHGNGASIELASISVTAGDRIVMLGGKYLAANTPFVAGDVTKQTGTATLGTIAIDATFIFNQASGVYFAVGLWSAAVTGTGTLRMALAAASGQYTVFGIVSLHSSLGSNQITFKTGTNVSANNATNGTPATPSASSTANAYFAAALATRVDSGSLTHTPGSTYTQVYENENGDAGLTGSLEGKIVTGSTSSTADWIAPTTAPWIAALAVYQEPGGATNMTLTGATTPTGSVVKATSSTKTGAVTFSGVLAALKIKLAFLSGSLTPTGSLTRVMTYGRLFSGVLGSSGSKAAQIGRRLAGVLTPSGIVAHGGQIFSQLFIGSIVPQGPLSWQLGIDRTQSGTISPAGALSTHLTLVRLLTGALVSSGQAVKLLARTLAGGATFAGSLTSVKAKAVLLAGSLVSTGSLIERSLARTVTGALASSGSLAKSIPRTLSGSLSSSGELDYLKAISVMLSGVIAPGGDLVKGIGKTLTGAATFTGTLTRLLGKLLAGAASFLGSLARPGSATPTPGSRVFSILAEIRTLIIAAESRIFEVHDDE